MAMFPARISPHPEPELPDILRTSPRAANDARLQPDRAGALGNVRSRENQMFRPGHSATIDRRHAPGRRQTCGEPVETIP